MVNYGLCDAIFAKYRLVPELISNLKLSMVGGSEAASLGFEVNWQKTKVQALGCREDMPLTIKVQGQDVVVVKEFVYLGSLIHSSTGSTCDISRRSAITRAAMQSLENQIWRSRLTISSKLKLYNTCILPIFLYGSDCRI